jgi:hypothetical protein
MTKQPDADFSDEDLLRKRIMDLENENARLQRIRQEQTGKLAILDVLANSMHTHLNQAAKYGTDNNRLIGMQTVNKDMLAVFK